MICHALPNNIAQRDLPLLYIINATADAIFITEIELRKSGVQVLLTTVLIHAFHAALDDALEAFDGVGADLLSTAV